MVKTNKTRRNQTPHKGKQRIKTTIYASNSLHTFTKDMQARYGVSRSFVYAVISEDYAGIKGGDKF